MHEHASKGGEPVSAQLSGQRHCVGLACLKSNLAMVWQWITPVKRWSMTAVCTLPATIACNFCMISLVVPQHGVMPRAAMQRIKRQPLALAHQLRFCGLAWLSIPLQHAAWLHKRQRCHPPPCQSPALPSCWHQPDMTDKSFADCGGHAAAEEIVAAVREHCDCELDRGRGVAAIALVDTQARRNCAPQGANVAPVKAHVRQVKGPQVEPAALQFATLQVRPAQSGRLGFRPKTACVARHLRFHGRVASAAAQQALHTTSTHVWLRRSRHAHWDARACTGSPAQQPAIKQVPTPVLYCSICNAILFHASWRFVFKRSICEMQLCKVVHDVCLLMQICLAVSRWLRIWWWPGWLLTGRVCNHILNHLQAPAPA